MSSVTDTLANARTFAAIYSRPKLGKTIAMGRAFPKSWVFANIRGVQGLPEQGVVPVAVTDVFDLDQWLAKMTEKLGQPGRPIEAARSRIDTIIADDLGNMAERTKRVKEKTESNRWRVFGYVGDKLRECIDFVEGHGLNLGVTLHERHPKTDGFNLGGPALPSENLSLELPKYFDYCFRMVDDVMRKPWPAVFWTSKRVAPTWIVGGRLDVTPAGIAPPNLAEIIRARGRVVPRSIDSTFGGEDWVCRIVEKYMDFPDYRAANEITLFARSAMSSKQIPEFAQEWIIQDAAARAEIRRLRATNLSAVLGIGGGVF